MTLLKKYRIYTILCLLGILASCTQYKNKFINRAYHNLTAHYNVYFYAKESIKDGVLKLETANKEDYTKLLPVFIYGTKETAKNIFPEMDRAIKKASLCIQKHAIKDKQTKVEIPNTGKWIDDSWIAIGKAHFYKREFFASIEALEYVQSVYKSKQKYEAWVWLIKNYNELNTLTQSLNYINLIKNDKKFPPEYKGHFEALYAEFYIKQGAYDDAIKHLELSIKFTKEKSYKARYHFILGQLYEMKEEHQKAKIHYQLAIKNKPVYDMVFYAKMRSSLMEKDPASIERAKKELNAMLKDIKNEDFKDVIYYTLGQMEEKEDHPDKAFDDYRYSVRTSTNNQQQKARSLLRLADMSFDKENYTAAAGYYDSTVAIIKEDFPDYQDIVAKKKSLNTLVTYVTTIHNEDSLQRLAAMDSLSRNRVIRQIIAGVIANEKKAAEAKQNQANSNSGFVGSPNSPFAPTQPAGTGSGAWYFYNPMLKAQGLNDFYKRWGQNRKNEDNWRRSNKAANLDQLTDNTNTSEKKDSLKKGGDSSVAKTNDKHQVEYYLKDLPLTKAALDTSNKHMLEAYYALGSLYREQLNNSRKSAETFEAMNNRFPKNVYEAPSYYQMYLIYLIQKEQSKAQRAKELLLTSYPNSDYAKIINDPSFAQSASAKKNEIENYYVQTYEMFREKKYADVHTRSSDAIIRFGKNDFTAKFAYLKALSGGYLYGIDSLEQGLRVVTIKYNTSEVYDQAKAMLDAVKKQKHTLTAADTATQAPGNVPAGNYVYNEDAPHYVLVILNETRQGEAMKSALSDFNNQFFSTSRYDLLSIPKGDKVMIAIRTFKNKDDAMDYYNFLLSKPDVFKAIDKKDYTIYAISADNVGVLLKKESIEDYRTFFNAKYLGIKQ
jgi:tetratricopeptide (TPR) repeat protein